MSDKKTDLRYCSHCRKTTTHTVGADLKQGISFTCQECGSVKYKTNSNRSAIEQQKRWWNWGGGNTGQPFF